MKVLSDVKLHTSDTRQSTKFYARSAASQGTAR